MTKLEALQKQLDCGGKGCGTDASKACLRCCRILLHNYDKNHGDRCDAIQEQLSLRLEAALVAFSALKPALQAFRDSDHSYDRAPTPEGQAVLDAWDALKKKGLPR